MKVQLATRLDTGLRQRLRIYAAVTGRTVEDLVSTALDGFLPSAAEMVRDDGEPGQGAPVNEAALGAGTAGAA